MKKKSIAAFAFCAVMAMSVPAFAGGGTYDVKDEKTRELLTDIKSQVQTIMEMLDVVKEKEKSLDVLNKAAAERTNDSMQKLSVDDGLSFVSEGTNNIDFGDLLKAGTGNGGFLEKFTEDLAKDGIKLKDFAKASPTVSLDLGDFTLKFDGIINGTNFEGLTDPTAIKTVYVQNLQELAAEDAKIVAEQQAFEEEKKKMDDKDEKRLEDITKAKDSKSTKKNSLWGEIEKVRGVLGQIGSVNKNKLDYGSLLSPEGMQTIFMKEGTESATAAQERTTSVESVRASKEMRESEAKAFHAQANLKREKIRLMIQINEGNLSIALGNAEAADIRSLPVSTEGSKYRSGFEKDRL